MLLRGNLSVAPRGSASRIESSAGFQPRRIKPSMPIALGFPGDFAFWVMTSIVLVQLSGENPFVELDRR